MPWPTQPDGKAWCWIDGDMPGDWRSRMSRAAVVEVATADPQLWLGIDLKTGALDGKVYILSKETDEMVNENLTNGDLERPYTVREAGEVVVAEAWEPWYVTQPGYYARPEFKEETRTIGAGRVNTGDSAQKMFNTSIRHNAGIWQRVSAVPGEWYLVTAWLYVWCSKYDDVNTSTGTYRARIGANPWGDWPTHYATNFGREAEKPYNRYVPVYHLFQAYRDEVSVIIQGLAENPEKHNDLYIDTVTMEPVTVYIDEEPPDKPPEPPTEPGPVDYAKIQGIVEEEIGKGNDELMGMVRIWMADKFGG